jgi:serine/threonine-protein kinase
MACALSPAIGGCLFVSDDASPAERPTRRAKGKLSRPPPPIGRSKIGRYDVIYPLAQGGMASVHVGRLSGMAGFEKLVAIKVIHQHLAGDDAFVKMFLDEARLAARIHHPNIGEVIEVGEDSGLYFMVCELIVGQSLRNVFRQARARGEKVPHPACADIAARICQGLHEAHDLKDAKGDPCNLVHRDVSPRNVLVSYNGFVKLIDFGIAWAHGRMSHTDAGTVKGKLGFMPPEQIKGEQLDRRSDIFSLGVVLYLMLAGKHPFPGKSDAERMHKILHGEYVPLRKIDPDIDPALEQIVVRAMAVSPDARFDTCAEMSRELMARVHAVADPPGSWDSSAEIGGLMHRLFEDELVEHRELIRVAAEQAAENEVDSGITPVGMGSASAGSASHTDLTVAGTPQSMQMRSPQRRRRLIGLGIAGGAIVLAALAVILGVLGSAGDDLRAADEPPGPASAVAAQPEPAPTAADEDPGTIRIVFDIKPQDAVITVDGKPLGEGLSDITLPADGEPRAVAISAEGYLPVEEVVIADVNQKISRRLEPVPRKKGKPGGKKKPKKKKGLGLIDSPY